MRKHRRKTRHRHIAVAAVALTALAVPSAAMACLNDDGAEATEAARPYGQWQNWMNASDSQQTTVPPGTTVPNSPAAPDSGAPAATSPGTSDAPAATSPGTSAPSASASSATKRVVDLVNSERGKAGCSPVKLNAKLTAAAQDHSADMASHRNMSHTGSDGSNPGQRITKAGYQWRTYGENVAYGYRTPEQVMAGWMSSPGHKRNILNCAFKEIGVGLAQPGNYWTQDFGTAR
ncbi:CAP domain-containing protein [Streptomyces spinoverrucosus]|uniref:CAP domain-containing protein n=1 Tax=Streptomyces spinoverrucosus TaxID=284043 RepID=UPI0018C36D30|nr:CAP domain-containing protein [Streptomyces spinoverrucosus]MBG0857524.1 CAP domain-containing protein [Streptomyces spinoverrucosus]